MKKTILGKKTVKSGVFGDRNLLLRCDFFHCHHDNLMWPHRKLPPVDKHRSDSALEKPEHDGKLSFFQQKQGGWGSFFGGPKDRSPKMVAHNQIESANSAEPLQWGTTYLNKHCPYLWFPCISLVHIWSAKNCTCWQPHSQTNRSLLNWCDVFVWFTWMSLNPKLLCIQQFSIKQSQ